MQLDDLDESLDLHPALLAFNGQNWALTLVELDQ